MSSQGKEILGKLCDVIALQQELEAVKKERDALLNEKKEWSDERIVLRGELKSVYTKVEYNLSKFFSSSQVEHMLHGTCIKRWSDDDISKSIALRNLSPKAYRYLKEVWQFPLPSVTTLNRWASKFNSEPGILKSVLNLLEHEAKDMREEDRLCVLSFDECSVAHEWVYDKKTDTLIDPKNRAMCVMIRGLVKQWKQLVYYDFDCCLTKEILYDIIQNVESTGFIVLAMVSDLSPTNIRLWKDLGICMDNPSFCNPAAPDRNVHVFADAPHLVKLIRNNFLDSGFTLANGSCVTSDCVKEIIFQSISDLKTAPKLSERHITVQGVKRMSVKLATQLLSETTAKTIQYFGGKGVLKSKDWKETSKFISIVDAWFDVMNSRVLYDRKPSRNAYGIQLGHQDSVLEEMITIAKSMKITRRNHLYQFQRGLVVSSQSLQNLYEMVKEKYGLTYILTYRLNQDGLEHFFGYIRQMGSAYDHPSPLSFKHRVRAHLLGKDSKLMGSKYNVITENNDVPMISDSFSKDMLSISDSENSVTDSLQNELSLSAVILTNLHIDDIDDPYISDGKENQDFPDDSIPFLNLGSEMKKEGLRYFGGYIAFKFPQHEFLGSHVTSQNNSWNAVASWKPGSLMTPSESFWCDLQKMEHLFLCYHGQKSLTPGRNTTEKLTMEICRHVTLPQEVIRFFARTRMFFRMRNLNRNLRLHKSENRKYSKLVK